MRVAEGRRELVSGLSPLFDLTQPPEEKKLCSAVHSVLACVCVCAGAAVCTAAVVALAPIDLAAERWSLPSLPCLLFLLLLLAVVMVQLQHKQGMLLRPAALHLLPSLPRNPPARRNSSQPQQQLAARISMHRTSRLIPLKVRVMHAASPLAVATQLTPWSAHMHTAALKVGGLRLANIIRAKAPPAGSAGQLQEQQQAGGGAEGAVVMARLKATAAG